MIPKSDTIVTVAYELDGARAWGGRHQIPLEWFDDTLELHATFTQPSTRELFFLKGIFDDYKEVPPVLTFCDANWQITNAKAHFPKPPPTTPFLAPIFIDHGGRPIICVPFNRLAYAQNGGPHTDWGGPPQWQNAALDRVHATTIGDMLQIIFRDINLTNGRMNQ